jgi:hypothetical protein
MSLGIEFITAVVATLAGVSILATAELVVLSHRIGRLRLDAATHAPRTPPRGVPDRHQSSESPTSTRSHRSAVVGATVAVSWLGEFVHNMADLPNLALLSPENAVPALIGLGLFLAWWRVPDRRLPAALLLVWGAVNLVGGALSVIPFGFLPFYPDQTVKHYLVHVLYAVGQVPLIVVAIMGPRPRSGSSPRAAGAR